MPSVARPDKIIQTQRRRFPPPAGAVVFSVFHPHSVCVVLFVCGLLCGPHVRGGRRRRTPERTRPNNGPTANTRRPRNNKRFTGRLAFSIRSCVGIAVSLADGGNCRLVSDLALGSGRRELRVSTITLHFLRTSTDPSPVERERANNIRPGASSLITRHRNRNKTLALAK